MSYERINNSRWDCKYHVVFIAKCRKKELYGKIREFLGPVFHEMARQKWCTIEEGHMVQDHVHMSAIAVAEQFGGRKGNFNGEKIWVGGYAVSTVVQKGMTKERKKRMMTQARIMVDSNKFKGLATLGVAHNRQAPRFAGTL